MIPPQKRVCAPQRAVCKSWLLWVFLTHHRMPKADNAPFSAGSAAGLLPWLLPGFHGAFVWWCGFGVIKIKSIFRRMRRTILMGVYTGLVREGFLGGAVNGWGNSTGLSYHSGVCLSKWSIITVVLTRVWERLPPCGLTIDYYHWNFQWNCYWLNF